MIDQKKIYSKEEMMIAERYGEYMYRLTQRAVTEIGPRESCSEEERKLGRMFAEELEPLCDQVHQESFTCSPRAFLGCFPYLVLAYIAGLALYFIYVTASIIITALGLGVLFLEVVRYRELVDPLFRKKEGENVVGTIIPRSQAEKRVVVSAHLDSAYEFKLWYWFKQASVPLMVLAIFAVVLLLGSAVAKGVAGLAGASTEGVFDILGYICIALSPLVVLFAFFHTRDVVPGAMDDMAGVSVIAGLAKYLHDAKNNQEFYPERTEVLLVGMSAEEAGLRGAKRYAKRHKQDFLEIPTFGIFLDGIYDERHLTFFRRELWPGAKHHPYLIRIAEDAASQNGFSYKVGVIPVGSTDASAFSLEGIPAMSICCQDNSRLVPNYHTRLDTMEYVRRESLVVCLQVVIDMLRRIDQDAF